ncbi:MAG: two-component regulator propeller domain-containing protein [Terriglobales bacterium]
MLGLHADASRILFDRDGALWFMMVDGLHRIPYPDRLVPWQPRRGESIPKKSLTPSVKADGSFQTFTVDQGLSSNVIWDVFQDREGNIWTATGAGVDRFRNNAFIRVHYTRLIRDSLRLPPVSVAPYGRQIGTHPCSISEIGC